MSLPLLFLQRGSFEGVMQVEPDTHAVLPP